MRQRCNSRSDGLSSATGVQYGFGESSGCVNIKYDQPHQGSTNGYLVFNGAVGISFYRDSPGVSESDGLIDSEVRMGSWFPWFPTRQGSDYLQKSKKECASEATSGKIG